ncbi:diguanylate cyclase [Ferrimonas sediminicola]|uniref:Diguanylate cyclase n=1 Tax=Ferrimonas sediminicola TaxID=2569538 RepID=A0A4U1BFZ7_9GAMM|nr:diguanylate cyclase [Ferrimonas sediminicola]TKB48941.1 diguanylate cyclase [Ferrimonas sediminicola]
MHRFQWLNRWLGEEILTKRRSYLLVSGCFILFGAAVALLSSFIHYRMQSSSIEASIDQRFAQLRELKLGELDRRLHDLDGLVTALAENPLMTEYLLAPTAERLEALQHLFTLVARSHEELMQVRYLDRSGMERVRVDRARGAAEPVVVGDSLLQDKGHRYYFQESRGLAAGQFWHSRLDLNRERGQLELPIRPTFRVATPVYLDNFFAGIVILNTEADTMLEALSRAPDFDAFLVDGDGEVLISPDPQLRWSRYLDHDPSFKERVADAEESFYRFDLEPLLKNGESLQVLMVPREEALQRLMHANTLAALMIAASVILISFPLAWLAAVIPAALQQRLQDTLTKLRSSTDTLDTHVISSSTDAQGRITHVSGALCRISGYKPWELLGQTHKRLRHPDASAEVVEQIRAAMAEGRSWRGELKQLSRQGETYWVNTVITPKLDREGQVLGYTEVSADVTDRKALEKMSVTDDLTGVFNRRRLDQRLEEAMESFLRYRQPFSVILLDLDRFKSINDTEGHQAGDAVLVQVAQCLKENLRKVDHLGRWGGEEFLVICLETEELGAAQLAEKLRGRVASLPQPVGRTVTVSIGVAQAKPDEKLNQLFRRVDAALYRSKHEGRNRVSRSQGPLLRSPSAPG